MGVKLEDVRRAQARVGLRQAAVAWGLTFAQTDLGRLMTSEQDALRLELHAFVHHPPSGITSDGELVEDVFDVDLAEAQQLLLGIFQRVAAGEPIDNPGDHGASKLVRWDDHYELIHEDHEEGLVPAEQLQAATVRLLHRLPRGYLIDTCRAPRIRQNILCGRVFLTKKATQRYCSPACQHRAGQRRNQRRTSPTTS